MTWKKVNNADAGTGTKFGGNDLDKVSDAFSGVDVDDITLNLDFEVQKGIVIKEQAAPASPAATKYAVYVDSGDGKLKKKDSGGNVVNLEDTAPTGSAGGDLTGTYPNPTIGNDKVTYAKIQNVSATDRLLGRDTVGAGDIEELTVGGGVEFTGTGIQSSAYTGDVTKSAGGTATTIANDAVTNAKAANMAANTIKGNDTAGATDPTDIAINANTVLGRAAGNIVAAQVATGQIADDAVTYAKIQNLATDRLLGRDTAASGDAEELTVGGGIEFTGIGGIQTSAFTGDVTKSAGGTATTIANDAVTFAKFQNITDARLLGRNAGSAGDMQEITLGTNLSFSGTTLNATSGAGGDSITVNGGNVTDADFDDATPAAAGSGLNVKWQKDASSPANISAYVQEASGAQAGIVTTGTQTLAGAKTFSGNVTTSADLNAAGAFICSGVISPTDATNQNDYNPTNLSTSKEIRWNGTASIKLTGLAGGTSGREIIITNVTTDYLLWLENENTASTAGNRFSLPHSFPAFLMPGDSITLRYDNTATRWKALAWPNQGISMGLPVFWDFVGGHIGPFATTNSGTGATIGISATTVDTTEKSEGIATAETGTTSTGRAGFGSTGNGVVLPTAGCALYVARVAVDTVTSAAQTYALICGFNDANGGTWNDGVAWEMRWNGSAAEWSQTRSAAGTPTRTTTGSPSTGTTQIWTVIFVNAAWNRADFIYSDDSVSFTLASSPTTGFPSSAQQTNAGIMMIKSAGTTTRIAYVDFIGYRVGDHARG